MSHPRILIQLDPDSQASSFDAVVAVDSGVEHLLQYSGVTPEQVESLVHGAIFTRGVPDLQSTAIFVGGTDVERGEALLAKVRSTFFGPMRVSVMLDANGANTTAAAAVLAAARHLDLAATKAVVLAATGAVGRRVVQLLAGEGSRVAVGSRRRERAEEVCQEVSQRVPDAALSPFAADETETVLQDAQLVVAAGAAGVQLLSADQRKSLGQLKVAIDLNAVPPLGLEGIDVMDKSQDHEGVLGYGAIGVGGTKMKIHKASVRRLFESNDACLDASEIFKLGQELGV